MIKSKMEANTKRETTFMRVFVFGKVHGGTYFDMAHKSLLNSSFMWYILVNYCF